MKRPATRIVVASLAAGAAVVVVAAVRVAVQHSGEELPCGTGFFRRGQRSCPTPDHDSVEGRCALGPSSSCAAPLVPTPRGCDAPPESRVDIPATQVLIGPSDWEAEGRVRPRTVKTAAFAIDRFEVSVGHTRCGACPPAVAARLEESDSARAAANVSRDEARAICAARGGRLPTEDEWIVAAAGDRPRRYPWGDTGAVCRRAAWGLTRGPCGTGATGPDTVGAHESGNTPLGVYDLAGNVEEWVEAEGTEPDVGVVRGGSFATDLATELRTWVRREVPASSREPSIGFRCAYEPVVSRTQQ